VQATVVATSSQIEHVFTTIEEHEPIKRRAKLAIVSYTYLCP
jgi:hypothetical protein